MRHPHIRMVEFGAKSSKVVQQNISIEDHHEVLQHLPH